MKMNRILWGFMMIAALALLAGCGGGGTSLMIGDDRATQKGINDLLQERDTAQGEVKRLTDELATANGDVTRLTGELATANGDVTRLTGELATANGDVTRLTEELVAANEEVTRLTGELATANGRITELAADLKTANERLAALTAPTEDPAAAKTHKVITAGKQAWRGDQETGAATAPSFETNGDMSKLDGTDVPKLQGSVGAGMGDFRQATFTKTDTDDNDMHKVVVFSDRDDLKNVAFNKLYPAGATTSPSYGETYGDYTPITGTTAADGTITFSGVPFGSAGSLFSSNIPDMDNDSDDADGKPSTFDGNFHGVEGTYKCTSDSCSVNYDAKGKARSVTGTMTFTPDNPKDAIKSIRPDADYLAFGYWLTTPEDGDPSVTVFAFGGNIVPSETNTNTYFTNLMGTARYEGPAVGKYARTAYNQANGKTVTVQAGLFSATANLTATFGGPETSANSAYTLQGTVNEFKDLDTNEMISTNWNVTLGRTGFASTTRTPNEFDTYAGVRNGTTETPGNKTAGMWNADFYGRDYGTDATLGTERTNLTADPQVINDDMGPMGVSGTFDATFSNGDVIGAFGATRQ